jgi:hypothetical protein
VITLYFNNIRCYVYAFLDGKYITLENSINEIKFKQETNTLVNFPPSTVKIEIFIAGQFKKISTSSNKNAFQTIFNIYTKKPQKTTVYPVTQECENIHIKIMLE